MTTPAGSTARRTVKSLARGIAILSILLVLLTYRLQSLLVGRNRSLEDHSELMSLLPGLAGRYLRRAFLACVLEECHPSASIGFGVLFSQAGARIGENAYIGPRCHIGLVTVERDALLGAGVHVTSGARTHGTGDPSRPIRDREGTRTRVCIGVGAWAYYGLLWVVPLFTSFAFYMILRQLVQHGNGGSVPRPSTRAAPSRENPRGNPRRTFARMSERDRCPQGIVVTIPKNASRLSDKGR